MKEKFRNNVWILLFIFLVIPIFLSILLTTKLSWILNYEFVRNLMSFSGYLFSFSSLILVFILLRDFRISDYKKSVNDKRYLDGDAIDDLVNSLGVIIDCVRMGKTTKLHDSCMSIKHVHRLLKGYEDDVILLAYSNQIKSFFSLLNKNKMFTIGFNNSADDLKSINDNNKLEIVSEADYLKKELERVNRGRGSSNEQ